MITGYLLLSITPAHQSLELFCLGSCLFLSYLLELIKTIMAARFPDFVSLSAFISPLRAESPSAPFTPTLIVNTFPYLISTSIIPHPLQCTADNRKHIGNVGNSSSNPNKGRADFFAVLSTYLDLVGENSSIFSSFQVC